MHNRPQENHCLQLASQNILFVNGNWLMYIQYIQNWYLVSAWSTVILLFLEYLAWMNSSSIRVQGLLKKRLDQNNRSTACSNQLPCILQHSMALSSVLHLLTPAAPAEYNSASTSSGKCAQLNCLHTQLLRSFPGPKIWSPLFHKTAERHCHILYLCTCTDNPSLCCVGNAIPVR